MWALKNEGTRTHRGIVTHTLRLRAPSLEAHLSLLASNLPLIWAPDLPQLLAYSAAISHSAPPVGRARKSHRHKEPIL